jgi:hypothetical protein
MKTWNCIRAASIAILTFLIYDKTGNVGIILTQLLYWVILIYCKKK